MEQFDPGDKVSTMSGLPGVICTGEYLPGHQIGKRYRRDEMYVEIRYDILRTEWIAVRDLEHRLDVRHSDVRTPVRTHVQEIHGDNLSGTFHIEMDLWVDMSLLMGQDEFGIGTHVIIERVTDLSIGDKTLFVTHDGEMDRYELKDIKHLTCRPREAAQAQKQAEGGSSNVSIVDEQLDADV